MAAHDPFRIVFVIDGFGIGGAERALLALVRGLDRARYRTCVFSTGVEGELLPAYREACDRVESHPKRHAFDLALVRRLARVIREEKAQLVVSVLFYADIVAAQATRLVPFPVVSWQHVLPSRDIKNRRFYHRLAYRLSHPRLARIVCCAECVRRDLVAMYGLPEGKAQTIHNGVDLARFRPHPPRNDPDNFRIGTVARFGPEKGQAYLVRAFPLILEAVPRARLVLVGDGPTRPRIETEVRRLNLTEFVEFPGASDRVEDVYPAFDVFVLASDYEAHPVSVLEAMACARPVVVSDLPGTRECVDEGKTGLFFPVGNSAALAAAIVPLAGDPERAAAMGRAARAAVERRFDLARQHEQMLAAFHEAAGVPL